MHRRCAPSAKAAAQHCALLDLGCGIGSIGLLIAASYPPGSVHVTLADRDKLAIYVTTQNAAANGLLTRADRPVTILPAGLDFEPARAAGCAPFDLIVTNVPAKVGRHGLERFLFGAGSLLKPGGYVATVHVTPLTETIDELLESFQEHHGDVESVYGSRGASTSRASGASRVACPNPSAATRSRRTCARTSSNTRNGTK